MHVNYQHTQPLNVRVGSAISEMELTLSLTFTLFYAKSFIPSSHTYSKDFIINSISCLSTTDYLLFDTG